MTKYKIMATRETYYEFEIEAETENQAIEIMENIEIQGDVENYAYDWYPLEVTEIEEEQE